MNTLYFASSSIPPKRSTQKNKFKKKYKTFPFRIVPSHKISKHKLTLYNKLSTLVKKHIPITINMVLFYEEKLAREFSDIH